MSTPATRAPSDHLLRTLAAVPVSSQILDLGCGEGRHTVPLLRLRFPVHACDPRPTAVETTRERVAELIGEESAGTSVQVTSLDAVDYPDATFDWIVADRAEIYVSTDAELLTFFEEGRRLLKPGGWFYVTLPAAAEPEASTDATTPSFSIERVEEQRTEVDLAEASAPTRIDGAKGPRIRAIYRRVDPHTPV